MTLVNGFHQSQVLPADEQHYYTAARQYLKDNGMRAFVRYMWEARHQDRKPELKILYDRFLQILELAYSDYLFIIFNGNDN